MIDDKKTLENSNNFVSNFSEAKYFILITDDIIWYCWMFFIQNKDNIYHVIIYFINHLINQNMMLSVFACFNWALKIDFKDCNRSLDTLHKKLTEKSLTSWHDEYSSMSCRQSLRISQDKNNETSQDRKSVV